MQKSSSPGNSFDEVPNAPNGTPVAGDADAVEKTTFTVGKGTDDRAQRAPDAADPGRDRDETDRDPGERRGTSDLG